ncbi:MAG: gliding motility-associated C-terminal domain-containing protein [Bacteroidetes bacterium]|nr:gliding motility-associated C-terminal domain-containing protein [Bacteroidota bacterium]
MRKLFFCFLYFIFFTSISYATHQRAAEITYKHLSGLTFEFTITMYTRTSSPADDTRTFMPISWGDGTGSDLERIVFEPIPNVYDITYNLYKGTHTFPAPGSYLISVEDPNRNNGVNNIPNSVNVPMYIETEIVINPFLGYNNSVQLLNPPIDQGCVGKPFIHNPGAYDPDGDSLSYRLVICKGAGGFDIPGYTYPLASDTFAINQISGDLFWQTPILQGEYNVAFVIDEWRYGYKVGSVRRDMQINIVACDHDPPEIYTIEDTCVVAGDFLQFDVMAIDPDGTNVTLTAFGGVFEQAENPAYIEPDPAGGNDTVTTTFNWPTTCKHVRIEPYSTVFKAIDDGLPVNLVNFKSVFIQVIAPAPENLEASALGIGINLEWEKSICENAVGYKIYRRSGESGWEPDFCETGVPAYTGFRLIQQIDNINTTTFRDDNNGAGLVHGINYCYRVTAIFYDEAESYASNEACAYLKRDVPIITHVSNDSLDLQTGHGIIAWSKPTELDTIQFPGPYKYNLYRNDGLVWNTPVLIASFNSLNDTMYYDDDIDMNTNDGPYSYRVELESVPVGYVGGSQKASSIFIQTSPTDQEVKLFWLPEVPWVNEEFIIYRKDPGETTYDSVGYARVPFYNDTGLINNESYCYYIKAIGHYSLPGLFDPLINFSQLTCATPVDNVPPCAPVLTGSTFCDDNINQLKMIIPIDTCAYYQSCFDCQACDCDAERYDIYYMQSLTDDFKLIGSVDYMYNDTVYFDHRNLESVVGCYAVTAVDSLGNVSDTSNIFCIDYEACPAYCLPNVFTPNTDGFNDLFVPMDCENEGPANPYANVERVDMTIFNRWGKIMYTTDDPMINWDGKNQENGQDCPAAPYFYICDAYIITFEGIKKQTLQGSITIVR